MSDLFCGPSAGSTIGLSNAQAQANQAALYGLGQSASIIETLRFRAAMTRQSRGIYNKSLLEDNFDIYMKECDKTLESGKC